ncbi:AraC family transcriptional regulator [Arcobacter lacus]|uniref:HTH araC/xylS-type domain-containing protein n=1 Tax=Arcobacter lacus TaxID=1912876 RepID=A0ABX5JK41_9BACT|nr:AraC family transcriptional regulator [Arcobacter lacus]PUE64808.1 hypothetical protein B0175_10375 [Arcobacter lacus]
MNTIKNEAQLPIKSALMILGFLEKQSKFNTQQFLKEKNITPKNIAQENFTVGMSFLKEPLLKVMNEEKNYDILYNLSKCITPNSLGILGYLMIHSKTVYESLDNFCKFYPLIGEKMKLIFTSDDEGYKIVLHFYDENGILIDLDNYLVILHLFNIIHLISQIISKNIKPKQMNFIEKTPLLPLENNKILGIKSYFAQNENSIYFSKSIINTETTLSNEYLFKIFEKEAQNILNIKLSENGIKERVYKQILVSTNQLDISLESISYKIGLSSRVLQKRLKEENTTFSEILLEVRKKLAIYYLSKDIDIETISLNMGYFDLSTFYRAFKKWYGITPTKWKEKNSKTNTKNFEKY